MALRPSAGGASAHTVTSVAANTATRPQRSPIARPPRRRSSVLIRRLVSNACCTGSSGPPPPPLACSNRQGTGSPLFQQRSERVHDCNLRLHLAPLRLPKGARH